MNRYRNKGFGLLLFLFAALSGSAQVLVKATADKDRILVGEPVTVTVEARLPLGVKLDWYRVDSIPHFEWIDKGVQQDTNDVDGKKVTQTFIVTSYDTGYWSIPRLTINVDGRSYASDSLSIAVAYSEGFNSQEDYHDIKGPESVKAPGANNLRWYIIGGILLFALILTLLLWKKKKPATVPVKQNPLTAYEEAMRSLAALRKERDTDDIKGFYTRLNDVLRAYLNRQLGIATFEKTNEEIILQSKQIDLPRSESEQLAQALRLSDFVKFAKYKPVASDNEKALTVIEAAINIINNKTTKKPG